MNIRLSEDEEKVLYWVSAVLFCIALIVVLLLYLTGTSLYSLVPPCPVRDLTGFYCPGCGGTRAAIALFTGHPLRSLRDHPIVLYIVVVGGWYLLSNTTERLSRHRLRIGMRYHDVYVYGAIIIIVLNWIVKNYFHIILGIDLL